MNEKMTSGEIAKKAGISQKAVRLYDQKGLLKPTEYSEGNYRLYDKEALLILEKIIALKQIGFSLEEIRDRLNSEEEQDIESILREQVRMMEEKKYQLEKSISAIDRTLNRSEGTLNWDDVAKIIQTISKDQTADERHWDALKHTGKETDWYVKIFDSLGFKENGKVLDLGCGYAKLWRNNWKQIPQGLHVYGYDLHGTWADDFVKYISEYEKDLPEEVRMDVKFMDVETEAAWKQIQMEGDYDFIVAHYLIDVLENREKFFTHVRQVLSESGMFSVNGGYVNDWHGWLKEVCSEVGVECGFLDTLTLQEIKRRDDLKVVLQKYFGKVDSVLLSNNWHYSEANDLYEKLLNVYPNQEKILKKSEKILKQYFAEKIENEGEIIVKINSQFWHCYK